MNHQPNEYLGIELWGKCLKSFRYYVEAEQQRAAKENAPIDSIYRRGANDWVQVKDLAENHWFRPDYAEYLAFTPEERKSLPYGDGR